MNSLLIKIILIVCAMAFTNLPGALTHIIAPDGLISEGEAVKEEYIFMPDQADEPPEVSLIAKALSEAGLTMEGCGISQIIIVSARGSEAAVTGLERDDNGKWAICDALCDIPGYVGRNGVSFDKVEGDGCTPGGLYAIGFAFGNMEKPETGLEYRKVTGQSYWVDDPDSGYYNQWVEGGENRDWKSAEHLSESKNAYAYAAVIEYNTGYEKIAGKGSAIFLHCGLSPTSGCVAVGESDMLKLLGWLKADKNPHILIVSENAQ